MLRVESTDILTRNICDAIMTTLTTFSATLCATVSFAELASANVVGYQERATGKSGWTLITGTFKNIGEGIKTLSDVTVNDVWDPTGDNIQFLDEGGGTRVRSDSYQAVYTYLNADWASSMGTTAGWYQVDALMNDGLFLAPEESDNDIKAGSAFIVQTSSDSSGVQFKAALPLE